jgi:ribosomal-protein-serine acetyltransferase
MRLGDAGSHRSDAKMPVMFHLTIRDGIDLRLLEERHAAAAFDVVDRNRAHLREWLPWVDTTLEVADTARFIKSALHQFANNEGFAAGIWCGEEFAGTIGFHKIDWVNRKAELGYWLAEAFQGRGIMTDVCRAAARFAFREWKLHRLEIHCATGNSRSNAVAKRIGFQLEATLRESSMLHGRPVDMNIWSMLARDWR